MLVRDDLYAGYLALCRADSGEVPYLNVRTQILTDVADLTILAHRVPPQLAVPPGQRRQLALVLRAEVVHRHALDLLAQGDGGVPARTAVTEAVEDSYIAGRRTVAAHGSGLRRRQAVACYG